MSLRRLLPLLPLLPLATAGCLLGEAYPERYAIEFCHTAFTCVEGEDLSTNTDWSDEAACVEQTAELVRADPKYEGFTHGDCTWDGEAAHSCLEEVAALRSESNCDGTMTLAQLLADGLSPSCAVVYTCDL